jgi:arginine N-succinyltransferase
VPLLPGDAQAAMGQIHAEGEQAFNLLTEEGFEADDYIDIFDGGPILQAHKNSLRTFNGAMTRRVVAEEPSTADAMVTYAVAASNERNFRAVTVACPAVEASDSIGLPAHVQAALKVSPGESVICVRI